LSKYWSRFVTDLKPYVPGEQPKDKKYIKLNTNENPYPPSPKAIEAAKSAATGDLRLYPMPECDNLREAIACNFGLNKSNVYVGNGSDEMLAFTFLAFFKKDKPILFPDITYSFYPVYCELYQIDYKLVELDENFDIPVDGFNRPNGGIIFPNPNAPTSKLMPLEGIGTILNKNPESVVVIDEAYIDFGGESAIRLINRYPNLLVIQTFSKSRSLAGLRIGFAAGQEHLIEALSRIKNSVNSYVLDRVALASAEAAIKDVEYFNETRHKVICTRDRTIAEMRKLGFSIPDSAANFIFASHKSIGAEELFLKLKERGILVRHFASPRIENYLRISVGTDEEMSFLVEVLKEILRS